MLLTTEGFENGANETEKCKNALGHAAIRN
jgi:hypothetical protein